jgi:hypothetical protein
VSHRCNICDYQEKSGSGLLGVNPGKNGRVKWVVSEFLCETCIGSIRDNYASLAIGDDDGVEGNALTLPGSDSLPEQ